MNTMWPFITVAIPVKNESRFIKATLDQLLKQDYPADKYEIIVADGNSTDNTREIVTAISEKYPQIVLMDNPRGLPSSGRNVGFKNGRGEYFVVVDGHCIIDNEEFFKNIAKSFQKSGADCLGRPQPFIIPEEPSVQRAIALARTSKLGHSSNSFIHAEEEAFASPVSMGCAYTNKVFKKIGYVDESFDACEDVEFNYRVEKAGFKAFFTPKIAVKYYPRESLKGLYKQLMRYGLGRAKFMFKHPETINLDMIIPILLVFGIVFGPLFVFISSYFLYAYFLGFGSYTILMLLEAFHLKGKYSLGFMLKIFITFPVIHFTLSFGLLRGIVLSLIRGKA